MSLRDKITDVLIQHSSPVCSRCECDDNEFLDPDVEDAILEAVADYLLQYPDDAIPDEVRALRKEDKDD